MKKAKLFTVLMLIFTLAMAIIACPGDPDPGEEPINPGGNPPTTVVAVTGVEITGEATRTVIINNNLNLSATILPADATNKTVTWSASSTEFITITGTALVCRVAGAKIGGPTTVTVTTADGAFTASVTVEVVPIPVSEVRIDIETKTTLPGSTFNLLADARPEEAANKDLVWSSDNEPVATVAPDPTNPNIGIVTTKIQGMATIKAASVQDPTKFAQCVVTVGTPQPINNLDELLAIKQWSASGTVTTTPIDGIYYLTADIDATSVEWGSLGKLKGVFDGRGHSIKIKRTQETVTGVPGNTGIFQQLLIGSEIRNLAVISDEPVLFQGWTGIIGQDSQALIENCFTDVQAYTSIGSANYVGGLVCNHHGARPGEVDAGGGGLFRWNIVVSRLNGLGNAAQGWSSNWAVNGGMNIGQATQDQGYGPAEWEGSNFWDVERANEFIAGFYLDRLQAEWEEANPEPPVNPDTGEVGKLTYSVKTPVLGDDGETLTYPNVIYTTEELKAAYSTGPTVDPILDGFTTGVIPFVVSSNGSYGYEASRNDDIRKPENMKTTEEMKKASTFVDAGYSSTYWDIVDGQYPKLKPLGPLGQE